MRDCSSVRTRRRSLGIGMGTLSVLCGFGERVDPFLSDVDPSADTEICSHISINFVQGVEDCHIEVSPSTGKDGARDVTGLGQGQKSNAAAISRGSADRFNGICAVAPAIMSLGIDATIRVSALGDIAFTVTPKFASSFAAVWVNPMMAAWAVA